MGRGRLAACGSGACLQNYHRLFTGYFFRYADKFRAAGNAFQIRCDYFGLVIFCKRL